MTVLKDRTTTNSFTVQWEWDFPAKPNGVIIEYIVYVKFLNFSYFVPETCSNTFEKEFRLPVKVSDGNIFTFDKAVPFAEYLIVVQAKNNEEGGLYSDNKICTTLPGIYSLR